MNPNARFWQDYPIIRPDSNVFQKRKAKFGLYLPGFFN
jgi:hypothetical protein